MGNGHRRVSAWLLLLGCGSLSASGCNSVNGSASTEPIPTAVAAKVSEEVSMDETASASGAFNPLTPAEERVILHAGTERPFVGEYTDKKDVGTYVCRRCNAPLYRFADKFGTAVARACAAMPNRNPSRERVRVTTLRAFDSAGDLQTFERCGVGRVADRRREHIHARLRIRRVAEEDRPFELHVISC